MIIEKSELEDYTIYFTNGQCIRNKKANVKNCLNELQAKMKLNEYLKQKHPDFKELVINTCTEDLFSVFGIFGKGFKQKKT